MAGVPALLHGAHTAVHLVVTVSFTNWTREAAIEKTSGGNATIKLAMTVAVRGLRPKTIATPAGRFTHTVGIELTFTKMSIPDAPASDQGSIQQLETTLMPKTTTMWFAKGPASSLCATVTTGSFFLRFTVVVPFLVGVLGGTPDTYQTAGIRRGTATSKPTSSGTTSLALRSLTRPQRFPQVSTSQALTDLVSGSLPARGLSAQSQIPCKRKSWAVESPPE